MNCLDIYILNKVISAKSFSLVMTSITEDEEIKIDNNETIEITRGKYKFVISPKDVYVYGDVDFSPSSSDLDRIAKFDFYLEKGKVVPAKYDYNTHTCLSDIDRYKMYDTTDIATIVKYAHGCINKPKKIIIFKNVIRK